MRTALRTIILAIREAWNPTTALFGNGEVGVFYDPSDFSTLFQDSAGTTPVTAVEQPVGLILDKSGNGKHASQATAASRPTLSQRVNLLTKTEVFSDAAWVKTRMGVTANAITAPDGTLTADKIIPTAVSTGATAYVDTAITFSGSGVVVICAKAAEYRYIRLNTGLFVSHRFAIFDLVDGTITQVSADAGTTETITALGDGWYRLTLTSTTVATSVSIGAQTAGTGNGASTDGTSGIYIWGASLVPADQASLPYQRVNTATDYDTSAVFPRYLKFDGIDDSLSTASIDFSGGDKMTVVAGVRKLSDAAVGVLVELSVNESANAGSMAIFAPDGAASNYQFVVKGTAEVWYIPTGIVAPITNVLSLLTDLRGAAKTTTLVPRINGVVSRIGGGGTTAGTGNFGNWPLYIGRRAGTSMPFNGHLYGLVVRARASTDAQIVSAETWMNSKTGAF